MLNLKSSSRPFGQSYPTVLMCTRCCKVASSPLLSADIHARWWCQLLQVICTLSVHPATRLTWWFLWSNHIQTV